MPPVETISELDPLEQAELFPTFASFDEAAGTWNIRLHGAVYRAAPEDVRSLWVVRLLDWLVTVPPTPAEQAIFAHRVRQFLVKDVRGKRLAVDVGGRRLPLRGKTRRDGHFAATLRLSDEDVQRQVELDELGQPWFCYEVVPRGGERRFVGRARLITPRGISVISDIDDTIKQTDVHRQASLLANTFVRQFSPVPSMAELYRDWAEQGAVFHYVSSSPYQLYGCLRELIDRERFPAGTFHLTTVGSKNPSLYGLFHFLWDFFVSRRRSKWDAMCSLLRDFPERKFVLIGDSGERDLELYTELARAFPQQVARIWIRLMPERPLAAARRLAAGVGLPADLIQEFADPATVLRELP